jgi:hypothetical protein
VRINAEPNRVQTFVYYDVDARKFRWFTAMFSSHANDKGMIEETAQGMLMTLMAMRNEILRIDGEDKANPDAVKLPGRWVEFTKKVEAYDRACTKLARYADA